MGVFSDPVQVRKSGAAVGPVSRKSSQDSVTSITTSHSGDSETHISNSSSSRFTSTGEIPGSRKRKFNSGSIEGNGSRTEVKRKEREILRMNGKVHDDNDESIERHPVS